MPLSNPTHFLYCLDCGHHKDTADSARSLGLNVSDLVNLTKRFVCSNCGSKSTGIKEKSKPEKMVLYVATIETVDRVFHRSTCGWMRNVSMENEIRFKDRVSAISKGFRPCTFCRP
jgi:hypothetical protein